MWNLSQALRTRPSDILGLSDKIQCYYFDKAVWIFGTEVEADIERSSAKAKTDRGREQKRIQVLRKWIPEFSEQRKFKDPALRFR